VIALVNDLPAERADDRNEAAGLSRAQATKGDRRQTETSSPWDAALVALVKLLARQVAEEHMARERVT